MVRALAAGADGYLLKDSTPEQVIDGIAITMDGGAPVSPAAAVYLIEFLRSPPPTAETAATTTPAEFAPDSAPDPAAATLAQTSLTQREIELLRAFADGRSYKEAARELAISPHTVGNHVKSIYRKLEVRSRSEALRAAGMKR